MVLPLIIIAITLIVMQICVIFNWRIKIKNTHIDCYWLVCLLGALICVFCKFISTESLKNVFVGSGDMNPLQILIVFISASSLSILLDKIGFFNYIAGVTLNKSKSSQKKIFFTFNIIIAILTIFTSNDIIILTFTPFICSFTKHAKIDPTPYLVSEFVSANAWSMFFYIDNPTNIYLCSLHGITFLDFTVKMFLPATIAGLCSMFICYFIFNKKLSEPIKIRNTKVEKPNLALLTIGLIGLGLMIIFMMIGPYIGLDIWYIPLICALLAYISAFIYILIKKEKLNIFGNAIKDLPYSLIPFLLSMSILVATLTDIGFIAKLGNLLDGKSMFVIGFLAFLAGNVVNNIPMTMLFTGILSCMTASLNAVYSVVIASNICAFLTPVGSLAGIMFMGILKDNKVDFSVKKFVGYGSIISIPVMLISLLMLLIWGQFNIVYKSLIFN